MTDPNGWPDPMRPGVPMNPERDGWHWLDECAREWSAIDQAWLDHAGDPIFMVPYERFRYFGPCLTPAEAAARVAEARREGMREAAGIAEEHSKAAKRGAAEEWGSPDSARTRARIEARAYEAARIAAAILARAEDKP